MVKASKGKTSKGKTQKTNKGARAKALPKFVPNENKTREIVLHDFDGSQPPIPIIISLVGSSDPRYRKPHKATADELWHLLQKAEKEAQRYRDLYRDTVDYKLECLREKLEELGHL